MLVPMAMDLVDQNGQWWVFALSAILTTLGGGSIALACANSSQKGLNIQQTFLLTTGVWVVLPIFAALPFVFGATRADVVDGVFEAMSGLTTTGSTVFDGLQELPRGLLLWRGMMQWFGGIGIIVVAMAFLPVLRVGGMQLFRSEGFDTFGKILPQAATIAKSVSSVYLGLTLACLVGYAMSGLNLFDATVHAMTTIATGGFANYDASFAALPAAAEYVAVVFMLAAALPFVRYVQLLNGSWIALLQDTQIRTFFGAVVVVIVLLFFWQLAYVTNDSENAVRKAAFNGVSK